MCIFWKIIENFNCIYKWRKYCVFLLFFFVTAAGGKPSTWVTARRTRRAELRRRKIKARNIFLYFYITLSLNHFDGHLWIHLNKLNHQRNYILLKKYSIPYLSHTRLHSRAISELWPKLSCWHGPAIILNVFSFHQTHK